jgi:hypothetical protein
VGQAKKRINKELGAVSWDNGDDNGDDNGHFVEYMHVIDLP